MKKRVIVVSILIFSFLILIAIGTLFALALIFSDQTLGTISFGANKIAVIEISGAIDNSDKISELIQKNTLNDSVKAIVLRINSPGGMVGASQEIYQEVTTARGKGKIIVASMGDLGASGAYYIACGTEKIVANPGTLTGSIGVIISFLNWQGLMGDKLGLKFFTIQSGKYKDTGSPNRPMTEDEKAYLQSVIDNVYIQFLNAVVEGRQDTIREILAKQKMTLPELQQSTQKLKNKDLAKIKREITYSEITSYLKPLAEGNIYTGEQAYRWGLVDELGNLETAVKLAARIAGIKGEPSIIRVRPREPGFFERMIGETTQIIAPLKRNGVALQYIMN